VSRVLLMRAPRGSGRGIRSKGKEGRVGAVGVGVEWAWRTWGVARSCTGAAAGRRKYARRVAVALRSNQAGARVRCMPCHATFWDTSAAFGRSFQIGRRMTASVRMLPRLARNLDLASELELPGTEKARWGISGTAHTYQCSTTLPPLVQG
jgi:hypothetical protein